MLRILAGRIAARRRSRTRHPLSRARVGLVSGTRIALCSGATITAGASRIRRLRAATLDSEIRTRNHTKRVEMMLAIQTDAYQVLPPTPLQSECSGQIRLEVRRFFS